MTMPDESRDYWRKCSSCKTPIGFAQSYYVCSVSTCNKKRSPFVFCSLPCWSMHVPMMGHRDPWAEEQTAPTQEQASAEAAKQIEAARRQEQRRDREESTGDSPRRRYVAGQKPPSFEIPPLELSVDDIPDDVLVVVSKLKNYIRARSGMNTSATVNDPLSELIRRACDRAIQRAHADGRKTVMDRDFDRG